MKKALTKNWGLKLLAFVFSVLLWIIVMNIEDPVDERTFSGIQVTVTHPEIVTNPGNTYQILDDSRTVSVTVKAKRSILNKIKTDDIRATADMKNLDVRTRSLIPIDISIPSYAGRFEATANPINLRVSIELGKSETFPITATSSGTPRDGYQVGMALVAGTLCEGRLRYAREEVPERSGGYSEEFRRRYQCQRNRFDQ